MSKPKLKNGWKYIKDDPPPKGQNVLVTNNPKARDAYGKMCHVWISSVIESSDMNTGFCGFDRDHELEELVAWHALPRNAI